MKILILLLVFSWSLLLLVNTADLNTMEMLVSLVKYEEKPTHILLPYLCWTLHDLKTFARKMSDAGVSVSRSLQPGRSEDSLHHLLIIVDLECAGVGDFLIEADEGGYFKAPFRWLLLGDEDENRKLLQRLNFLVDSDVVLIKKEGKDLVLTEVYRISNNSELIYTTRLVWHFKSNEKYNTEGSTERTIIADDIDDNNVTKTAKDYKTNAIILNEDKRIVTTTITKYGVVEDFRETKVLSVRRMNLKGHTLTVANVIAESNETIYHLDDRLKLHQDSITKMSYIAVKICFEMLNATERRLFANTWGYKDKNGNWQGIIEMLLKKEADLGTLSIFTLERMEAIDYIAMVGSTSVRFVFREPPLSYISNIFAMPFTAAVWLACFVCVLCCSIFLYIASKWEASMGMHPLQLDGSWADVFILAIGAVLQQGCTLEPRYAAGRCVTLLLFLALTILFSAYSANIVVLLRAPSSSIRTLSDLLNSPLKVGASDFEYNRYFFKKLNESIRKAIYDKKIAPKGKKPNFYSMKDGVEKIRKGLFAFHMELNPGYRLIQETYQEGEKCDLVEIDYINEIDPWVPGQKRSPFKDMFKINFLKLRESGIQACNQHRIQVPRPRCSGTVTTFSSVGIADLYPVLLASSYVVLLAPTVLLLEKAYKRLSNARRRRLDPTTFRIT